MNTPLYPSTIDRGQLSSETLLNVTAERKIQGISVRKVSKIFNLFGVETKTSTPVSSTSKSWTNVLNNGEIETLVISPI